jgi:cytochrome P450
MKWAEGRYGETFTLRVRGGRPWVFFTNPEHAKQIFTVAPETVRPGAGEANPLLPPLLGSSSLMLLDEPEHLVDRKRLLPSFHGSLMFALWPRMQAISLEVVMRLVWGDTSGERMEEMRRRLVTLTNWVNHKRRLTLLAAVGPRAITADKRFKQVMAPAEELVLEEVRERRAAPERYGEDNCLAMLERSYNADGRPMSDEKLRDELITLLSDGPTATSLAWTFERLLRHPDKFERLREEQLREEGEEYLEAVVTETLRLCPTVPVVMRRLVEPLQIGGYVLPADTIAAIGVYLIHMRPDVYPDPERYRPERFLEESAGTYSWIPFGGGVRRCVAASFAPLEMRRVIQTVIREVDLRAAESRAAGATRSSVSFAPDSGALVIATRRRPVLEEVGAAA